MRVTSKYRFRRFVVSNIENDTMFRYGILVGSNFPYNLPVHKQEYDLTAGCDTKSFDSTVDIY